MDKEQAKNLIRNTLESSYDKEKFEYFVRNLLKSYDNNPDAQFTYSGQYIPEAYREYIKSLSKIGKYQSDGNEIDILVVHLEKETSLYRARTMQRNFIARYLKDAAIVAFVSPDNEDWRFSLVKMDYRFEETLTGKVKVKEEFTPARRWSFLVGENEKSHTAQSRFLPIIEDDNFYPTLEDLEQAFSVEPVTKQFYGEIQTWYFWAMDKINFPNDYKYSNDLAKDKEIRNATNLIRLITRIIFIWFLKKKGLIPPELFLKEKLEKIVKDFIKNNETSNFYNAILQNLFFGTLNQKMNERKFAEDKGYSANKKEYGIKNLYRYADKFLIDKNEVLNLFKNIPFLNGGLFDCLDKEDETGKVIYIDGFSRNPVKQAIIPDYLFFQENEERVDLSNYGLGANKPVKGLIEILNNYNFTIDENTPIDQEIALDPELLGKVFENLLASYNPETATTARKATGSYYTPREIVDYMAETSICEYLKTKFPDIKEEKIKKLLSYSEENPVFLEEEGQKIISAIDEIKVLDPACGSGAFPMGVLHKLVSALQKLDPENKYWYELQYQKALKESEKVFKQGDKNQREDRLKEINETFDEGINYPDYARKLYLIENCIYGVDIQPIAIQISKLRFFISLVLDQKVDRNKENSGIRSLPNLETRFVSANTLIGVQKPEHLFYTDKIGNLEDEIKSLRHKYFQAKTRREKIDYQNKDKELRELLAKELKNIGFSIDSSEKIAKFDLFDQNASADWFDPEWMFGVTDGFDVVIGNPPYIQLQKDEGNLAKLYEKQHYETFSRMGDIYTLFYEKGLQLLKPEGHLCFITSNKWMRAGYGEGLRKFFQKYNPKILIDLGPGIFESATVDTNILIIQKKQTNQKELKAVTLQRQNGEPINIEAQLKERGVTLSSLTKDAWFIGSSAEQKLKEKIERIGKPLKDWDVKIYRGVLTGLNEAFIIDSKKREEILASCNDEAERMRTEAIIKPILRGRDIKRYYYEWAGLWVIVIPAGWTNKVTQSSLIEGKKVTQSSLIEGKKVTQSSLIEEKAENELFKLLPSLMNYLLPFKAKAKKRDDQGDYWWELRHCAYYSEFEKEKVVWQELAQGAQFTFDSRGEFFVSNTAYILTGKNLKFILGYLNSTLNEFSYNKWYCTKLGQSGTRWLNQHVQEIPLPPITPSNQSIVQQIEALVDKILSAKKENPQADTIDLEREIDRMVYKLYELTEEEIKIIEGQ